MKFSPLLCAPLISLGLNSCGEDTSVALLERERERVELAQRLELVNYRLERNRGVEAAAREFRKLQVSIDATASKLDEARRIKVSLDAEVQALGKDLVSFRARVLDDFRKQWIGDSFEELQTASGRIYRDATIVSISDIGVAIRHREGTARLSCGELGEEQRRMFALDPNAARLAEEQEQERLLAYEREIDRELALQRVQERRRAAEAAEVALAAAASTPRQTSTSGSGDSAMFASASPLSQSARPLGDGRRSYRVRNRSNYTYYYVAPPCGTYAPVRMANPRFPVRTSYVAPSCGASGFTWANPPTP